MSRHCRFLKRGGIFICLFPLNDRNDRNNKETEKLPMRTIARVLQKTVILVICVMGAEALRLFKSYCAYINPYVLASGPLAIAVFYFEY